MKPNQLPRAAVLAALGASAVLTACSAPAGGDTSFFDGTSAQPDAEEFGTRREALGARADVTATLSGPSTATPGAATSYTVLTRNIGTKNAAST